MLSSSFLGTGLIGGGVLVLSVFGLNWYLNRDKTGKKPSLPDISKIFQKEKQNEIKSIDTKQTQITAEIKKKEILAEKSQNNIRNIVDEAAKDIEKIIETDMTIKDIQNEIDSTQ